jgi:hypothetical protein
MQKTTFINQLERVRKKYPNSFKDAETVTLLEREFERIDDKKFTEAVTRILMDSKTAPNRNDFWEAIRSQGQTSTFDKLENSCTVCEGYGCYSVEKVVPGLVFKSTNGPYKARYTYRCTNCEAANTLGLSKDIQPQRNYSDKKSYMED